MDLNLVDPQDVPRPRDEVRLRQLAVTPQADGRRLRIDVDLTPFLERPNLDFAVLAPDGGTVARTSVIEADSPRFSLTMHLRGDPSPGEYRVRGTLSYASAAAQDEREGTFVLEAGRDEPG